MRLLTFSLKKCKHKSLYHRLPKQFSNNAAQPVIDAEKAKSDPDFIEISPTWKEDENTELRAAVLRDMTVFPNFVSEQEEASLLAEIEPYLKKMRYEFDHWDNAIQGYRETERSSWLPQNEQIFARIKRLAMSIDSEALPHVHVLDLAANGHIKPHVDAVRFCGDVIAGLSLLSSAVMKLEHSERPHLTLQALLQRRSLYIMRGTARYAFSHAVLGGEESEWKGNRVPRQRRIALICRSKPGALQ